MRRVDRVLDVRQGELCWVAGTVYMDLPMKPNILEDLSKEVSTSGPFLFRSCSHERFSRTLLPRPLPAAHTPIRLIPLQHKS